MPFIFSLCLHASFITSYKNHICKAYIPTCHNQYFTWTKHVFFHTFPSYLSLHCTLIIMCSIKGHRYIFHDQFFFSCSLSLFVFIMLLHNLWLPCLLISWVSYHKPWLRSWAFCFSYVNPLPFISLEFRSMFMLHLLCFIYHPRTHISIL